MIQKQAPKGYVDCDTAVDVCRNMNNIQVRIIRIFVHSILLLHHCCDKELSALKDIKVLKIGLIIKKELNFYMIISKNLLMN